MSTLRVYRLGRVEYEDGLALMERIGEARLKGLWPDTLLLLEHPPVLTLGRGAKRENVLCSDATLEAEGAVIHQTNRGGDVTYHGPGQIVGYPIFHLQPGRQDVRRYVRDVEGSIFRVLAKYGITAGTIPKWPGVWVGQEGDPDARKIAAIGVHISRWLTTHGFALNVNTNLNHFRWIVPCGIREAGVTSMQQELSREVSVAEVEDALADSFAQTFDAELETGEFDLRTVSVAVLRRGRAGLETLLLKRTPERGGFWQTVTGRIQPGEMPVEAAARELQEETGRALEVQSLEYAHAFALGTQLPPVIVQEHGFAALWPDEKEVLLDPAEHDAQRWLPIDVALAELPFAGLRETVKRAAQWLKSQ